MKKRTLSLGILAFILSSAALAGDEVFTANESLRQLSCSGSVQALDPATGQIASGAPAIAIRASIEDTRYTETEADGSGFTEYYSTATVTDAKNPGAVLFGNLISATSDTSYDIADQRDAQGGTAGYNLSATAGIGSKADRAGVLVLESVSTEARRYKISIIYGRDLTKSTEAYQGSLSCD